MGSCQGGEVRAPMKTMRLVRFSPSAHGRAGEPSNRLCTPCSTVQAPLDSSQLSTDRQERAAGHCRGSLQANVVCRWATRHARQRRVLPCEHAGLSDVRTSPHLKDEGVGEAGDGEDALHAVQVLPAHLDQAAQPVVHLQVTVEVLCCDTPVCECS